MKDKIYKLKGVVKNYAWGGYQFIPDLLGIDNLEQIPYAEYWLGTHALGPSQLVAEEGLQDWAEAIKLQPEVYLGQNVSAKFGGLPFLLKVLDVREMLSIQVHPSKDGAEQGYALEEQKGILPDAYNRNYKDRNHKPEMMIALNEFWLLHGFRNKEEIVDILTNQPELNDLLQVFQNGDYHSLYKMVMEMPQEETDKILLPLIKREICNCNSKHEPGFWIKKLYKEEIPQSNIDRGIFSIFFFNIVKLNKGEGIFQADGVPHAYLEGQNIELMSNSDNVLRGGLTNKHIDVQELLRHTRFHAVQPEILRGEETVNGENMYKISVEDFGICSIYIPAGHEYLSESTSAEIILVIEGEIQCEGINCKKGEALAVLADARYTIHGVYDSVLYKAFVPGQDQF